MDEKFDHILANLPDKRPRSRLEPYRELIEELRRRKRTFQEIADVLAENCGVKVTGSAIHDFLRRRDHWDTKSAPRKRSAINCEQNRTPTGDERDVVHDEPRTFEFDPLEPLRLDTAAKRRGSRQA